MNLNVLYAFVCVPIRLGFPLLYHYLGNPQWFGIITLIMSIGFGYSYLNYKNGDLGLFKGIVWWNTMRLIHSIILLITTLMMYYNQYKYSVLLLLFDVLIGIIGYISLSPNIKF